MSDRVTRARDHLTAHATKATIIREPDWDTPGESSNGLQVWYHGTSMTAYRALTEPDAGHDTPQPTYQQSNVSLGGMYLTTRRDTALVYARQAAQANGEPGNGILLTIETDPDTLQPDEDWVVNASEDCEADDMGLPTDERLRNILTAVTTQNAFTATNSLSEGYKEDYEWINRDYNITWEDSLRWNQSARMSKAAAPDRILTAEPVEAARHYADRPIP